MAFLRALFGEMAHIPAPTAEQAFVKLLEEKRYMSK
jgi:hypothetical protein